MPKCPNCPTFTSKDTDNEPEGDVEVDSEGHVTGDIRIHNDCAECSTELEETTFSVDIDLTSEVADHWKEAHEGKEQGVSVDSNISRTDTISTKDRHGKTITNPRYRKRMYGIEVSATVTCDDCNADIASGELKDETQASGMEWIALTDYVHLIKAVCDGCTPTTPGKLPNLMVMSGALILRFRPDLANEVSPNKTYCVTQGGITELEGDNE